jgi:hypothetical protein
MPGTGNQGNKGGFGLLFNFTPCGADGVSALMKNAPRAAWMPILKALPYKLKTNNAGSEALRTVA